MRHIVNRRWLFANANLSAPESLTRYAYTLHGHSFFVYGKSTLASGGMATEAEVALWKRDMEGKVEDCAGTLVTDFIQNDDDDNSNTYVVLPNCSRGSE